MTTTNNNPDKYLIEQLQGVNMAEISSAFAIGVDIPEAPKMSEKDAISLLGVMQHNNPKADIQYQVKKALESLNSNSPDLNPIVSAYKELKKMIGNEPVPNIKEFTGNEREEPTRAELKKAFSELSVFLSDDSTGQGQDKGKTQRRKLN